MKLANKLRLLLFAAGIGIFSCAQMGMRYLTEQAELLMTENLDLKSRLKWLENAQRNRTEIVRELSDHKLYYEEILKEYPDHLGLKEQLIRLDGIERQYAMDIRSVVYSEKKIVDQKTMKNADGPLKYTLLRDEIAVDMDMDYENWESWIRCSVEEQPASEFSEMSAAISENGDRVSCHAVIRQYAITEE